MQLSTSKVIQTFETCYVQWPHVERTLFGILLAASDDLVVGLRAVMIHAEGRLDQLRQARLGQLVALLEATITVPGVASLAKSSGFDAGKGMFHGLPEVGHAERLEATGLAESLVLVVDLLLGQRHVRVHLEVAQNPGVGVSGFLVWFSREEIVCVAARSVVVL